MDEKQTAALREVFERWEVSENGWDKDDLRRHPDGIYHSARIHEDWSSWLACYQHLAPQWQPIETAPKDRQVLFLVPEFGVYAESPWIGGWSHLHEVWTLKTPYVIEGKAVIVNDVPTPTHWMPLPAAPDAAREQEKKTC